MRSDLLQLLDAHDDAGTRFLGVSEEEAKPLDIVRVGSTLSGRYSIRSCIGSGGMSSVYEAEDLELGGCVALKIMRVAPGSLSRFRQEIQLARQITHKAVYRVFDVGSHEGLVYYTMELLCGETLSSRLLRGPLDPEAALGILEQIAGGLSAAHARGIIHRDLKPSNIMLVPGSPAPRAVILDFGIAKSTLFLAPDITRTGQAIGTAAYMAPEQKLGGSVTESADIYSLGLVAVEMVTGAAPPDPLAIFGVPVEWRSVIERALHKDPASRFDSVDAFIRALMQASSQSGDGLSAQPGTEAVTIAVLPLMNLSSDSSDEYICDGLAEELINGLTQIDRLRVVSRNSTIQCKGTTLNVPEIGRKLHASHVVHGSLRRSGDRLRVTAQLSETRQGYQLWSGRFDAAMKDLFALQDELSEAILEGLGTRLSLFPAISTSHKRTPVHSEAHQLYLRARHYLNQQTGRGLRQALQCLNQAVQLDPNHASTHLSIAECYALLEWYGLEPARTAIPQLREALQAGLNLTPNSANGLCLLATVQAGYDWDWRAAQRTFQSAMAVGSGFAAVWFHYALDLLTPLGRLEEALEAIRTALELDPLSPITNTALGGSYYRMRRWMDAAATLRATLEMNPEFGHAHWTVGRVFLEMGEGNAAMHHFEEAIRIMGRTPDALAESGYCFARLGIRDKAREILAELDLLSDTTFVSPVSSALLLAGLGERDSALLRLEQAFHARARKLVWLNVDPRFDVLKEDMRFQNLVRRIGLIQ